MDPGTGNIYTTEEAEKLGLDTDDLIPLEDDEAAQLLEERRVHAEVIKQKRREQNEQNAEMRSRTGSRNKRHARERNKAARTARRGNR